VSLAEGEADADVVALSSLAGQSHVLLAIEPSSLEARTNRSPSTGGVGRVVPNRILSYSYMLGILGVGKVVVALGKGHVVQYRRIRIERVEHPRYLRQVSSASSASASLCDGPGCTGARVAQLSMPCTRPAYIRPAVDLPHIRAIDG
jgi:hypothetical protein